MEIQYEDWIHKESVVGDINIGDEIVYINFKTKKGIYYCGVVTKKKDKYITFRPYVEDYVLICEEQTTTYYNKRLFQRAKTVTKNIYKKSEYNHEYFMSS